MPSASDVEALRAANRELVRRVERDLNGFWASLDLSKPERVRDALLRFVPALTTAYGDAAAVVAADWFDAVRASEGVPGRFRAGLAAAFPAEFVESRVRFGAGHLFTADPGQTLVFLAGAVQEYVLQPGRDTVARAAVEDPAASGWERRVRGDGCRFCRGLASRGAVYRKETAGFASHGHCTCVAVPSWDPNAPEVPAAAYVASEKSAAMSPEQRKRHTARVREWLDQEFPAG